MAIRHQQRTCDVCGLPGRLSSTGAVLDRGLHLGVLRPIKEYTHPNNRRVIEAHPACVGQEHQEVEQ